VTASLIESGFKARSPLHEVAWMYRADTVDFVHFDKLESSGICDDKLAVLTNAHLYGLPRTLILCESFFDTSALLDEEGLSPASDELGEIDYRPGVLLEKLLRLGGPSQSGKKFKFDEQCETHLPTSSRPTCNSLNSECIARSQICADVSCTDAVRHQSLMVKTTRLLPPPPPPMDPLPPMVLQLGSPDTPGLIANVALRSGDFRIEDENDKEVERYDLSVARVWY